MPVSKPFLIFEKEFFCPDRMEFVGHDVCANGNRPAMSKHALMEHWPAFVTARDIASYVGFLIFYSCYIPCFEQRIACLRELTKNDMETVITDLLTSDHEAAKRDMINAITSDPCIARLTIKNAHTSLVTSSRRDSERLSSRLTAIILNPWRQ